MSQYCELDVNFKCCIGSKTCELNAIVVSFDHGSWTMKGPTPEVETKARMNAEEPKASRLHTPVSVVLEKRMATGSFWALPSWYLHTVAVGHNLIAHQASEPGGTSAGTTDKGELYAWSNLGVTLYKDACERYWHALIGDKPLVYVICKEESMQPVAVTVDYDEASACAESDAPVLSTEIPAELYRAMEQFVIDHYRPVEFKKRKRQKWAPDRQP